MNFGNSPAGTILIVIDDYGETEKSASGFTVTEGTAAKAAVVNHLEIRVLKSDNSLVTSMTDTPSGGKFEGSINVEAQNDLKVLCIGSSNGVVERYGIDNDVDVAAGKTTAAVITGWTSRYIPEITGITPYPSIDGAYSISWNQVAMASAYVLEESENQDFSDTREVYSGADLQQVFSGKVSGMYYYRVKSVNDTGIFSGWSQSGTEEVEILPLEVLGITLVTIPAGSFEMGSENGYSMEKPVHTVTLDGFEMSSTEITQAQYEAVTGTNPSYYSDDADNPVETVSWVDAAKFCNLLSDKLEYGRCYDETTWKCDFSANGFRLPTEAEWEYACRAGTTTKYYTGDTKDDLRRAGWFDRDGTMPVGQKEPNAWGLYDMHGNVAEYCYDLYDPEYYSSSPVNNPTGPDSGNDHVIRGGSWAKTDDGCRVSFRTAYTYFLAYATGFRIVRR